MNGGPILTAKLNIGVAPKLKTRLRALAQSQHRTLSNTVRMILEEALELEESFTVIDPQKDEYEIRLTVQEATHLVRKGHNLQVWEPQYSQLPLL